MAPNETANENNNNNTNNKKVEIHSVLTMVSSTPVNPKGRIHKLTALDRAMGKHNVHIIVYYRSGTLDFHRIRPSLNEVLSLYPNVTGRLVKDNEGNWEVKFTDAGVRVYLAKVGCSVDEWLKFADGNDEINLTVREEVPDDTQFWSPFRVQVTEFEGGGAALALSCPHMLADPLTVTLLIKSWTDTYNRDLITHPPFLHPLAFDHAPKTTTLTSPPPYGSLKSGKSNPKPLKMGSATFSFSETSIKKSLSEACSGVPNATPFEFLTALFWSRIARLKSTTYNSEKTITICVDMRKRLSAPLPSGYFGNAGYFSSLTLTDDEINGQDLGQVTKIVHRFVTGMKEEELLSTVNWLDSRKDDQGKSDLPFKMYGPELTSVNMDHLIGPVGIAHEGEPLMYMASFEKGQIPAHVSYQIEHAEGEGLILVMPSPEGGLARRVSVTLPEEEIAKLVEDGVILGLKPTLLLSGSA